MLFLTPALTAYLVGITALLGLVLGSFCNAWAWRLARGESIAAGRSHCACCGHLLAARDLVPLLSYLCLKGRCRYCGAPVSRRYPAIEVVSAAFFVSILLRYDISPAALRLLLLGCLLLTLSLVDWETREIPDGLLAAAAALALLRLWDEGISGLLDGVAGGFGLALPLLLVVLLADKLLGRETMGGGDIKLLFVLGLHLGPALGLMLLLLASLTGLLLAAVRREGSIPFGPALALSTWVVMLFGAPLLDWYLGLFIW